MRLLQLKRWLFLFSVILLFAACQKELTCEDCNQADTTVNEPPVAHAGIDLTITLGTKEIKLDGSLSTDADHNITSYAWTKVAGPAAGTIANTKAIQTVVTNMVRGTYQFELKVTDAYNLFSKDTVVVIVTDSSEVLPSWTKLRLLPVNEFLLGSNHINFLIGIQNKVFAISKNGTFWYYNPQDDSWTKKADMPSFMASSNFSVVFSVNNIGYIIGNGTCRQYNVLTDGWVTKNNAPIGADHVDYSVPLVIGSKVYLVGSTNNRVTMYDPASDSYVLKNKFSDVGAETGFVVNGEGYCIQKDGRCWKYDPVTDTWQQKGSLPPSIYNKSGFTLNGHGYIIGDLNRVAFNQNGRMKLWRYDRSSDQWKDVDRDYPGQGVYEIRTASLDGIVYAGLGYTSGGKDAGDFWSLK